MASGFHDDSNSADADGGKCLPSAQCGPRLVKGSSTPYAVRHGGRTLSEHCSLTRIFDSTTQPPDGSTVVFRGVVVAAYVVTHVTPSGQRIGRWDYHVNAAAAS